MEKHKSHKTVSGKFGAKQVRLVIVNHFLICILAKNIILCADDYGLNPSVSKGILSLLEKKRLSAVSVLTNFPQLEHYAPLLNDFQHSTAIGLHLNFTEGLYLSNQETAMPLNQFLLKSHFRQLNKQFIKQEFDAQIQQFYEQFQRQPDFIDGHQHIHQLPLVRDVLIQHWRQNPHKNQWIRATWPQIHSCPKYWKSHIITATGGKKLASLLDKYKIPRNSCFSGIYDFNPHADYRRLFQQWIGQINNNGLIMCHPAHGGEENDGIIQARNNEFNYLQSDAFLEDCDTNQILLGQKLHGSNDKPSTLKE